MILDVKKYKLGNTELKKNEMKLLLLLSDNEYHKTDECKKYLGFWANASISKLKKGINKKLKEEIIANRFRKGYQLILNIEITY